MNKIIIVDMMTVEIDRLEKVEFVGRLCIMLSQQISINSGGMICGKFISSSHRVSIDSSSSQKFSGLAKPACHMLAQALSL